MHRAYSVLTVKSIDDELRVIEGIATTPSADRMGDIVEPTGAEFKLPLPLLMQHDSSQPIGHVTAAKVSKDGISIKAKLVQVSEPGALKTRLDEAWQLIKSGLVRGLSIGFRPTETARIKDTFSERYIKWLWLELSAVVIPANADASILSIKSADQASFAASGDMRRKASLLKLTPGVSGHSKGSEMKTIQEQIAELKAAREQKCARMSEIMEKAKEEDRRTNEAEGQEFDALDAEIGKLDDEIRTKSMQLRMGQSARAVPQESDSTTATQSRGAPMLNLKVKDQDEKFKGQNYTRMVIAKALARLDETTATAIAMSRWAKSNPTLVSIIKINEVAGGSSESGSWGAELVQADTRYTGDFIEFLTSKTVYDKLPLRQVPANVTIKGRDGGALGYWIGQSKAIKATADDFSSVSLRPLKVAALAVVSNELLRDSTPAAEMLVRDALVDASSQVVDKTFLSTDNESAGVSPKGMLYNVSATTSAGSDADGVRADIAALYAPFIAAKNATGLQFVTNPALAKALQLMRNALGQREFDGISQNGGTLEGDPVITGDNVGGTHLILLKPSDIYRIGDTGVQVSISRDAMIEQATDPTGDTEAPTAASKSFTSMFQSESTAIKVVRSINFAKRRSGAVAYVDDATYGTPASS